jgi:hypothetical protein
LFNEDFTRKGLRHLFELFLLDGCGLLAKKRVAKAQCLFFFEN